jgi:hypothetical protein
MIGPSERRINTVALIISFSKREHQKHIQIEKLYKITTFYLLSGNHNVAESTNI